MSDERKIHAERSTIYDSVHIPPGREVPERIVFWFGADAQGADEEQLFILGESEIIGQVLGNRPSSPCSRSRQQPDALLSPARA